MVGFLALAIDLGMLAIAKTQAQQAADLAALTACATLNGNSSINYNQTAATTNAQNVVTYNTILGNSSPIVATAAHLRLVRLQPDHADVSGQFPGDRPARRRPRSRRRSRRTALPARFSTILKAQLLPNVTATAQAVHRPRDIALVMDLSGSMRYRHLPRIRLLHDLAHLQQSRHPDPDVRPLFVDNAGMQGPSTNQTSGDESYTISPSNTTAANSSYSLDIREQLLSKRRLCIAH